MSDEYTRKYGSRSRSAPECYGDVDLYDISDHICETCTVRRACKVIVDKELRDVARSSRGSSRRRRSRTRRGHDEPDRVFRSRDDSEREDQEEDDTFFGALFYNGTLSAMKAVLVEAHHGVDSIPLVRYPNPFLRMRRAKSKEDTE